MQALSGNTADGPFPEPLRTEEFHLLGSLSCIIGIRLRKRFSGCANPTPIVLVPVLSRKLLPLRNTTSVTYRSFTELHSYQSHAFA